mmetsp:Transcript_65809/g.130429  ORF Transcript_65809/g.130429 Transcript_65809/m.130429 type:complete len:180 (-) Transcript_65809:231-770(-)
MLIPVVEGWSARHRLSAHILLMPLSFLSMLGGMCTLIGTSTNLVLNALIEADEDPPCAPFSTFSMTPYAVPAAIVAMAALLILAPLLLRKRPGAPLQPGAPLPHDPLPNASLDSANKVRHGVHAHIHASIHANMHPCPMPWRCTFAPLTCAGLSVSTHLWPHLWLHLWLRARGKRLGAL